MAFNFLDPHVRESFLKETESEENKERKRGSVQAFDIYRKRQSSYVIQKLKDEFNDNTVKNMRKIMSVNLAPRIVNELASIYDEQPDREYGPELNDDQKQFVEDIYEVSQVDNKLKQANRYFKLATQSFMSVIPKDGMLKIRNYLPHQIDVVNDPDDPEKPLAYIISTFDRFNFDSQIHASDFNVDNTSLDTQPRGDGFNQGIADVEDYKSKSNRFIWWTKDWHFVTNRKGEIVIDGVVKERLEQEDLIRMINPIGEIPFIDISMEKDDKFFVEEGYQITDFAVDLAKLLSDTANTSMLQSYAQAVISSEKAPTTLELGPQKVLWLQQDPDRGVTPSFSFEAPSPNVGDSLEVIETVIRLFLNSMGLDPKAVSGEMRFSSGIERLLAMIDKAQATNQDRMLFKIVEQKLFKLITKWLFVMRDVSGPGELMEELRGVILPDDVFMSVKFNKPEMIKSDEQIEAEIQSKMESGRLSRIEAIMMDRDVDRDTAIEIAQQIDEDDMFSSRSVAPEQPVIVEEEEDGEEDS